MKKRIFIVIFVFSVLAQNTFSYEKNFENNENFVVNENFHSEQKIEKVNFTKKDLKKEIKKRKKYHRVLLEKYNKNFEKKYFNLIKENSLILTNLRKEFKS